MFDIPITFTMALNAPKIDPKTSQYFSPKYSQSTTPKCPNSCSSPPAFINGKSVNEISRLHAHAHGLVIETPFDGADNLLEVGLAALSEGADDGAKAIEHDLSFLANAPVVVPA